MPETNLELLDKYAGIALEALISKLPLLDTEGTFGQKATKEEITIVKKELTGTAYEYASYMLISRQESIGWLKENNLHVE